MVHYLITGHASAQLPLRILGLLAQRDCIVGEMCLHADQDCCRIAITVDLPWPVAMIVLEKVRALVEVTDAGAMPRTKRAA